MREQLLRAAQQQHPELATLDLWDEEELLDLLFGVEDDEEGLAA
jgi:hypothetical protein